MPRRRRRHYQRSQHVFASRAAITRFCHRWGITRLQMFGSALRDDFRPDSDIDMVATFEPDTQHTLLDLVRMERELGSLYGGRTIDLGEYDAVQNDHNDLRRESILNTLETIYEERRGESD
ncbi:MAG: nucleotidyltransferase domain-containing protein [Chloroflexi bacterium]|jgi:predicted nucleotidyltransferase|nr:MAG: DNA polymerase subunit beta [Chloroflexi bacterium OLB13]MBC6956398.1 nucleotidyltransferase [Chloroflexota bacterium]MBV6438117.1 hypothetical protein [Anaerolineae bacterium]MDL1917063.1 nucleotidyltransferase [Anaerolineae bacterium CFX4]OQY77129.1 MAG: hypothetical protein B6D42_16720 [Anaerolineae bacterium UTCFX5]